MTSTTFYYQPRSDKIERKQSGALANQKYQNIIRESLRHKNNKSKEL
jgi:hypothetical protein